MNRKIVKITGTLCIAMLLSVSNILSAAGSVSISEKSYSKENENVASGILSRYDEILTVAGTPKEILNSFSNSQKKYIVENLKENAVYQSSKSYIITEDAENQNRDASTAFFSNLPKDLVEVTVSNYTVSVNGVEQEIIFPSFKWLKNGYSIGNDSFGFALHQGWYAVPDSNPNMAVYLSNAWGRQKSINYAPINATQYGYIFQLASGHGNSAPGGFYEGYAVFYAKKNKKDADDAISIIYVHDNSLNHSILYSIDLQCASLSISSEDSNLMVHKSVNVLN